MHAATHPGGAFAASQKRNPEPGNSLRHAAEVELDAIELLVHLARHPSIEKDSLPNAGSEEVPCTDALSSPGTPFDALTSKPQPASPHAGAMEPSTPSSVLPNHSPTSSMDALPHAQFLMAPHMRTGKGGRKPSVDPRMDPTIDPKRAKRILANRLSAAKSTLKRKMKIEMLTAKIEGLLLERSGLERSVAELEMRFCAELRANAELKRARTR